MTRFTWAVCPVSQCWPTRLPSGRFRSAKDSRAASRTSASMESAPRSRPSSKTTILQVRPVFYSLIIYAHAIIVSKYWIGIYSSSLNKNSRIFEFQSVFLSGVWCRIRWTRAIRIHAKITADASRLWLRSNATARWRDMREKLAISVAFLITFEEIMVLFL